MFVNPGFSAFDPRSFSRLPQPTVDVAAADRQHAPGVSQVYAAAWGQAQRDHELDKLFNVDFYDAK
jgi:hypothetical protein